MEVGIIGVAKTGKTTLFNALTGSRAEVGAFHTKGAEPNRAVVKVPDPRVERLVELFDAKKTVHAAVTYIDVAGVEAEEGKGVDESLLHAVANCEALLAVIRGFENGGIAPDIQGELESLRSDLILTDFVRAEARIEKIETTASKQKPEVKKKMEEELVTLVKCKEALESDQPIRSIEMTPEDKKIVPAFQFLTIKPLIIVINLGEDDIGKGAEWEETIRAKGLPVGTSVVACSAQSEMEIAHIEDEGDRKEFLESYGIEKPAADRVIQVSYETLGLISFFTAGPKEVHAWTLRRGETVVKAAGTIHSDLERGFIRSDVIGCEDLLRCGSMAEAKKEGVLRLEGKTYVTQDGDVIEVRFSV